MKINDILCESVIDILDYISSNCEKEHAQCAKYLATMLVMRDMGKMLQSESDKLQQHTYVDYLYGGLDQSQRALKLFHKRIQENPRARRLFSNYETQLLDSGYGCQVIRNRVDQLKPYFNQRKVTRLKYHEDTLINNLAKSQEKVIKDQRDQYDLSDGDKIRDDQTAGRPDSSRTT